MEETSTVECELTDYLYGQFREWFDIEMLKGEHRIMPNGMRWCKFELRDESKELFDKFIKALIAVPSDQLTVKYMGNNINPN